MAVVLLLVPYHTFRVFDIFEDWYVKNAQLSTALYWFNYLGDAIGMQLLFLLAGASTWFALRRKSGGRYAWERVKRLLIPLCFGILVIVPPQSYLGLRHHSGTMESFLEWYPSFFNFYPEDAAGYSLGGFTVAHLWFILFLFIITLVALPLFHVLKRESGQKVIGWLANFCSWPGVILLLAVPIIVAEGLLDFYPNPLYFLTFFIYGYIMMTDARFEDAIDRSKGVALILGLVAFLLFLVWQDLALGSQINIPEWFGAIMYRRCIVSWLLIIALLGYGKRYLNSPPKRRSSYVFLGYFGEGSYPFYILHQTVIVVTAFFVVQWAAGVTAKYLIIASAAYLGTIILYDLLVRRTNVTRFLFGMRPLIRKSPETPTPRQGKSTA
jgi:peptidoglycan/LPS O-acetylase OafA/YrhL